MQIALHFISTGTLLKPGVNYRIVSRPTVGLRFHELLVVLLTWACKS